MGSSQDQENQDVDGSRWHGWSQGCNQPREGSVWHIWLRRVGHDGGADPASLTIRCMGKREGRNSAAKTEGEGCWGIAM